MTSLYEPDFIREAEHGASALRERLPPLQPRRTLVLQAAAAAAAFVLIAVIWVFTFISMDREAREANARAEGNASNLAVAIQWQLNRQLQGIDQTLRNLAVEWQADPVHFEPNDWRRWSALLGDVSLQVYVLDTYGFVASSTDPSLVGYNVSQPDFFSTQRTPRTNGMLIGPTIHWKGTGPWEINLTRRINRADGSFAGAIVISYDPRALTGLLEDVELGSHGLIELVGSNGTVRALVASDEVVPAEDIGPSDMFRAVMQSSQGTWTGLSAPDRFYRVHAFRRLHDQDLTLIVGIGRDEAMRRSTMWASSALLFAGGVSVTVLLMATILIREIRAARGREIRLNHDRYLIDAAYAELKESKGNTEAKAAQIAATLAAMSDGVMVLDANFCLTQWNDRFAQCAGVPVHLLQVGQSMGALLRGQAQAGEFGPVDVEDEIRQAMFNLRNINGTVLSERSRPDGSTLELRRSNLPGGGILTLYTDVTARKRAYDVHLAARRLAEEATEQKSRFVATVSHEIRTPLNAVVNSLILLDESGLSTSQHRLANTARQAGDALLELINDILELSKMEAGRLVVHPSVFSLREVMDNLQAMFSIHAASRGIRLVVNVAPEVPDFVRADAGRLRQVLMNFVSNAAKFSDPGDVTVKVVTVRMEGQPMLMLSVQDQGPLISDVQSAQLFQPFSRLDNARVSGVPGTGLGLAICEKLARLMGGQIGLREAQVQPADHGGGGTGGNEFWITLPLDAATSGPRVMDCPVVSLQNRSRANILLVEDIPANHLVTATLLRREGHRVDIAESGAAAICLVARQPYDLVFMDLLMPGMNGLEATRRIRAMGGPPGVVPIVALTANTAPEDRLRCLAAGMNDMLGKPVRPAQMFSMLGRRVWPEFASQVAKPVDDGPILDIVRLADLQQGLPASTLISLVDQCLEDMRGRVLSLTLVLEHGNAREIEEVAHAVAGMAGTYGLAAMDSKMRRIIKAARDGEISLAGEIALTIDCDLAVAAKAIRAHLAVVVA